MKNQLSEKILNATKWSAYTEIGTKMVSPITNMILARLLVPEAFGVIAIITMIISLADMFTDAGFQKYLVQSEFKNKEEKYNFANVAFWTNLGVSIVLWGIIVIFRDEISSLVGNPNLGNVIALACSQLVLTSFSSIQMSLYRRDFDFKTLFWIRLSTIFVPFFVTIPLAFLGLSYWSLVIGSITIQLLNTLILTIKSKWKPKMFYSINILKKMLSFSVWSLIEAISIWLTVWIDIFIIGSLLNEYYLGLYSTSTTMVNALMALVTASVVPVLFSALSRYQNDFDNFKKLYFKAQRMVAIFIFPLGIGVYIYSDLAVKLLLGDQWKEASNIIGLWALTSALTIVFGHFCSEVYRAKGLPKLSFLAQVIHLVFLIPTIIFAAKYGFWILIFSRSLIRLQAILVHFILMKTIIKIPIILTLKNVFPMLLSSIIMGGLGWILNLLSTNIYWDIISILICIIIYFGILYMFGNLRLEIIHLIKKVFLSKLKTKSKVKYS